MSYFLDDDICASMSLLYYFIWIIWSWVPVLVGVIVIFYNVFPSYCPACMATMHFDDPWPSDYYEGSAH